MKSRPNATVAPEVLRAQAEEHLFATLDLAPVGLVTAALDGRVRRVNACLCQMLGYDAEEVIGTRFQDLTHPGDLPDNEKHLQRLVAGEIPGFRMDKRYLRRDGTPVWADLTVALVRDASGAPQYLLGVVQDISPRYAVRATLERREQEFLGVLAEFPDIIARFGPDLRHRYVNAAITRSTGLEPEQFVGRTNRELGFPEEMCATWERLLARGFAEGEPFEVEWEWTNPSGTVTRYHSRVLPERDSEGRVATLLGITRDLGDARQLERALTAEERYRALVEATSAAVWRAGPDGLFHGPQPSWEALTGQSTGEVRGIGWLAAVHPEDRKHTLAAWTAAVAERTPFDVEHRVRTASGEWRPMHARAAPVAGPDGAPVEWVGTETDISARQRAQATVRFQSSLLGAVDHAVIATDLSGRVTYWNAPASRLLGWSAEEMGGRDLHAVLGRATWPGDPMDLLARLQADGGWSGEAELERRDGTRFHALVSASAVRNEAGGLTGVVRVLADVTGLKHAEAAARESESRFRGLALTSPDCILVLDVDSGAITYANRAELLGWPLTGEGASLSLSNAMHPDEREAVQRAWDDALQGRERMALEHRLRRPDGEWEWIETRHAVLRADEDGSAREMLCTLRVVTDRRRADEALRHSEEHLRGVLDHVACAVGVLAPDGELLYANRVSIRATGARPEEAVGRRFDQAPPWSHSPAAQARVRDALGRAAAGETVRFDERARLAGGEITTVDLHIAPMRDAAGAVTHLIPTAIDIGPRVQARAELAEQEIRLRLALRATGAVMWEWDAAMGRVEWDAAAEERFGWGEALEGTDAAWWAERLHPDDRAAAEAAFDAVRGGRAPEVVATYRFRHADGGWVAVRDRGYPLLDEDGRVVRIVGVMVEVVPPRVSFPLPPLRTPAPRD